MFFVLYFLLFCLVARAAIRRTRSEPRLLTAGTEWLFTSVAGEESVLRYRPTVSAALLRGEAYLPARRAVPGTGQLGFCFLSYNTAIITSVLEFVLWASRVIFVVADLVTMLIVDLAATRVRVDVDTIGAKRALEISIPVAITVV